MPDPAELVGVRGGKASLETEGARRVIIASRAPAVTGNAAVSKEIGDNKRVAVAFIGQVPVKARGSVEIGDLIVPSGKEDGTARAVAPSEYRRSKHGPIAGHAWSEKTGSGVQEVTVAVGVGESGPVARRLENQKSTIDSLRSRVKRLEDLERRVAELDPSSNGWALAHLPASGFLLGALAGLLGAGLLWRRQG